MKILHIGSLSSQHTQIAALAYLEMGYNAVFLNIRKDVTFSHVPGVPEASEVINPWSQTKSIIPRLRFGRSFIPSCLLAMRYMGKSDQHLVRALESLAGKHSIDFVVGTWGLPVLETMLVAQRIFSKSAFVHNILTIPDLPILVKGWRGKCWRVYSLWFDRVQRHAYRVMLTNCDVRVHCSQRMLAYVKSVIGVQGPGMDIVRLERFNRRFFPKTRLAKISSVDGEPHVVHIGATNNFSGQTIDDLTLHFRRMTEAKIHVHFHSNDSPKSDRNERLRYYHSFSKFSSESISGDLAEFATQFDAVVMLYNVDRAYERFVNALPTRFLFALIVGIPIAVPKGLFMSCEEYILKHKIGFTFESEGQLAKILADNAAMRVLEMNAFSHSQHVSLEDNLPEFESLFAHAREVRQSRTLQDAQ